MHIAVLCPELSGHLNPMGAFAKELQRRGHRISVIARLDAEPRVVRAGFEFCPVGEQEFPCGWLDEFNAGIGKLSGRAAGQFFLQDSARMTHVSLRDTPAAVKDRGVDALLVDQTCWVGSTIAEHSGIPFVSVSNALILNPDPAVPPPFFSWRYSEAWWAQWRNRLAAAAIMKTLRPIVRIVNDHRGEFGLAPYSSMVQARSPLAQISQEPAEFEFPRRALPKHLHFVGPLVDARSREAVDFPFDKLGDQPIVYASMGTLVNRLDNIFRQIIDACEGMDIQLVLSLGGAGGDVKRSLPGWPLIVDYAPQLEILKRASLTITHAGLNTTLESLSHGVPLVAIPIAAEQPGVAARIAWTGTGEIVPLRRLRVARLREAINRVLSNDSYRQNAVRLQEAIARTGGAPRAADIAERAFSTLQPVVDVD